MGSSRNFKRWVVAFTICVLATFITTIFPEVTVPIALATSSQEEFLLDSTPSLVVYPSQLNEQNCQTGNNKIWTCVVTLEGENLEGIMVVWNAYTSNPNISINPNKGYLVELAPTRRVTISNIPCTNSSFLFSGQVYGGGGVIPATVTWSCMQQPTPIPTYQPTPIPTPQPRQTPKTMVPTSTPVATAISKPTPTMVSSPTSVISSGTHNDPPVKGNGSSSANVFMVSVAIFLIIELIIAIILITLLIRRIHAKRI